MEWNGTAVELRKLYSVLPSAALGNHGILIGVDRLKSPVTIHHGHSTIS